LKVTTDPPNFTKTRPVLINLEDDNFI
jgi:hypothetical protein